MSVRSKRIAYREKQEHEIKKRKEAISCKTDNNNNNLFVSHWYIYIKVVDNDKQC